MYEKFYRFTGHPFRLSPDPAFFFGSKGHRRALAYLRYGLTQKEGFIVVTGAPGTGKTTLARALLQETAKDKVVIAELNNTHLQADDVLRMAAASFGLEHENLPKSSLLKRLEGFFLSKYRVGYHCLLLIDEAQNLPIESLEELRMLSNFYHGKHALLQIFLMGQQQFRDLLYSPNLEQLRQRVVAATHLESLDAVETRDYAMHRLKHVGWKGNNPAFSKRAFAHIFALTKGIPRRINTFCDRLLLYASLEELTEIRDATVRAVARELMYEIAHKSTAPTQSQAEVLNDVKDVDTELDAVDEAESDFDLVSPDDIRTEFADEADVAREPPAMSNKSAVSAVPGTLSEASPAAVKPLGERGSSLRFATGENTALAPRVVEDVELLAAANDDWVESLAVAYANYREPKKFPEWLSSSTPLPPGMMGVIQTALGKWVPSAEQMKARFGNASGEDVKKAARHFIDTVCLSTTADYYRRLGLSRRASDDDIKLHYRAMFRLFQPDQASTGETWDKSFSQKIGQAHSVLHDIGKRRAYDAFLDSLEQSATSAAPGSVAKPAADAAKADDVFVEQDVFAPSEFHLPDAGDTKIQPALVTPANASSTKKIIIAGAIVTVIALLGAAAYFVQSPVGDREQTVTPVAEPISPVSDLPAENPTVSEPPPNLEAPPPVATVDIPPQDTPVTVNDVTEAAVDTGKKKRRATEAAPAVKTEPKPVDSLPAEAPAPNEAQKDEPPKVESEPVRAKENTIQTAELKALINKFALSYEEADVDALMALFSENASTNDSQNKAEIRKDYLSLFKSSDMRVIDISGLNWKIDKTQAVGNGDFKVTVLRKGGKDMRSFVGNIQLTVEKRDNKLFIKEIFHAYSMDERQ